MKQGLYQLEDVWSIDVVSARALVEVKGPKSTVMSREKAANGL